MKYSKYKNKPKNSWLVIKCNSCKHYIHFFGKERVFDFTPQWEGNKLVLFVYCPKCEMDKGNDFKRT
jgi:ribosomal protein S27E